jgi:hypothetical protein
MPKAQKLSPPGGMQTFVLLKTITVVQRVEVSGFTREDAEATAAVFSGPQVGDQKISYTLEANWPINEEPEHEYDLGNGFRVRRGWFWVVRTAGTGGHYGPRTISFLPDLVDPCNYGVTAESFANLVGAKEKVWSFSRHFGWAASQGGMSTWSNVFPNDPNAAYKSCRRFVEEQKQFTRDRQRADREREEQLRIERLMDKVILRAEAQGGVLTRLPGGKWVTKDPGYYPNSEPVQFEEKWMIVEMINAGYVEVTDTMNVSGDPRVVHVTMKARERAAEIAALPEFLR